MTLVIDTFVVSEGAANDSRGNLSLISFNPQVLVVDSFPSSLAPVLTVIATEESGDTALSIGDDVVTRLVVADPSGETVFFAENGITVNALPGNDLPRRVQVVAQVPFTAGKAGDYQFTTKVLVHNKGIEVKAVRKLRISRYPNGQVEG